MLAIFAISYYCIFIKPPTLGIFPPPEITCDAPSLHPLLVLQDVRTSLLMDAVCVLSMSYVTYSINVVSLDLTCNILYI